MHCFKICDILIKYGRSVHNSMSWLLKTFRGIIQNYQICKSKFLIFVFPFFQSQTTKLVIRVRKNTVKSPASLLLRVVCVLKLQNFRELRPRTRAPLVALRATSVAEPATQHARTNYHPVSFPSLDPSLLKILDNYGLRRLALKWMEPYLIGRKQFVSVKELSA